MALPINRTTANTADEHVADHNALHGTHNRVEAATDLLPAIPWSPVYPIPSGGAITATWPAANLAEYIAFRVDHRMTLNRVAIYVGTSSGNIDVGIYDNDGTDAQAGTRLSSSGSIVCPAAGAQAVTIAAVTLDPGWYWVAMAVNNTTASFRRMEERGVFAPMRLRCGQATSFPLPTPAAPAGRSTTGDLFAICPFGYG